MRIAPFLLAGLVAIGLSACQRSEDPSDVSLTSGPAAEEQAAAADAASEATPADAAATSEDDADPAQQSAPPASDAGDMGDARSHEDSVEPDSPTMFH